MTRDVVVLLGVALVVGFCWWAIVPSAVERDGAIVADVVLAPGQRVDSRRMYPSLAFTADAVVEEDGTRRLENIRPIALYLSTAPNVDPTIEPIAADTPPDEGGGGLGTPPMGVAGGRGRSKSSRVGGDVSGSALPQTQ